MNTKYNATGFTVLELLVVIGVIGILAGVLLLSVNTWRGKGADKGIASDLQSLRIEAQQYWVEKNGTFGTFTSGACPATLSTATNVFQQSTSPRSVRINQILDHANKQSGGTTGTTFSKTRCVANGSDWAVAVTLKSNTVNAWCVDSQGRAKSVTASSPFTTSGTIKCN